jgi:hypothetical protein
MHIRRALPLLNRKVLPLLIRKGSTSAHQNVLLPFLAAQQAHMQHVKYGSALNASPGLELHSTACVLDAIMGSTSLQQLGKTQ